VKARALDQKRKFAAKDAIIFQLLDLKTERIIRSYCN